MIGVKFGTALALDACFQIIEIMDMPEDTAPPGTAFVIMRAADYNNEFARLRQDEDALAPEYA